MAPVKNPFLVLEVARLLPEVSFLMAGDCELFKQIKEQAPTNVRLLNWVDAAEVIPVADIFLSTSLNEGIPYSFLEVLSAGIPVVAVESGAIAEIITHGLNGILCSQISPEIAAQILSLFSKSVTRLAVGESELNSNTLKSITNKIVLEHTLLYVEILLINKFG